MTQITTAELAQIVCPTKASACTAGGTNVEGELHTIRDAVKQIHETLHAEGTTRLSTMIKIGTRTDTEATLESKLF